MNNYKLIELNTARNAVRYIIKAFDIKELYIPYYLCPAIRTAVAKEDCKLKFYHIDLSFKPVLEFPDNAFILYPDYFGVCTDIVEKLNSKYTNLIVDNAHSFFSEPRGIASFNSLRKFFPKIRDGAFLYTKKTCIINFQKDNYEYEYKKLSFEELCKNENRLDNQNIKYMSECTKNFFSNIDLNQIKQTLSARYNKYNRKYSSINRLKLTLQNNSVPYKYPFLAHNNKEADEIAKKLEKNGELILRYWNNLPDSFTEKEFYTKLIAI